MLTRRFEEVLQESLTPEEQKALEERLEKVEGLSTKVPETRSSDVVSAGDFPGSIRIPGTDAAVKFGGGSGPRRCSRWTRSGRRTAS